MNTRTTTSLPMRLAAVLAAALLSFGAVACDSGEEGLEGTGQELEEGAEGAGQELEEGGEAIEGEVEGD